jgi:hypothetical protein
MSPRTGNESLPALRTFDALKINAAQIGGRNRVAARRAGCIEGGHDFVEIDLLLLRHSAAELYAGAQGPLPAWRSASTQGATA